MIAPSIPLLTRFTHPTARTLQRYADGDAVGRDRARVIRHLPSCQRCRDRVAFSRDVAAAARALTAPPPRETLARVLAERALGERLILPADDPKASAARRPRRSVLTVGLAAASALAIGFLGPFRSATWDDAPSREGNGAIADDSAPVAGGAFTLLGLLPSAAYAQEPTAPSVAEPRPPLINGRRVRPGRWEFTVTPLKDGRPSGPAERGTIVVESTTYLGAPAWRARDAWLGHPEDMDETTVFDAGSLRPLHRLARNVSYSKFTVEQHFVGDTLVGSMQATKPPRPAQRLARRLPRGARPYGAGDAFGLLFFQSVLLHPAWQGRVSMLGWGAVANDLYYPVDMRVDGEETVTVPAGSFACWRLTVTARGHRKRLWVRKADGTPIRTRDPSGGGGASDEVVLVAEPR